MIEERFAETKSYKGKSIVKNTFINLAGQGLPLLVGLFTIPLIIKGLGVERFGILTLAWMVIGYFSFFDLGLGRALTQIIASSFIPKSTVAACCASEASFTGAEITTRFAPASK